MEMPSAINRINFIAILTKCMVTVAVLIAAGALSGDLLVLRVHWMKQYGSVDDYRNFKTCWISAMISGFGIYFFFGTTYHWWYYRRQRDKADVWKCQPRRWLPKELEWHEIKVGSLSLFVVNSWSAMLAFYIANGGYYCTVYYSWNEYGPLWWLLQWPLIFLYQDYMTYWLHRLFHKPYLYERFHKVHHKYVQPTAFSVTAIHPVEVTFIQLVSVVPLFTVPIHWPIFHAIALYVYYHGITSHSGINFKAYWWQPWQPDTVFHDNHHQYYHVNFGFNTTFWDKLHNTYRKPDRIYRENIFYGRGKPIQEISNEELENEKRERETESRSAYSAGYNPYLLDTSKTRLKTN